MPFELAGHRLRCPPCRAHLWLLGSEGADRSNRGRTRPGALSACEDQRVMLRGKPSAIAVAMAEHTPLENLESELAKDRRVPPRLEVAPIHRDPEEVRLRVPPMIGLGEGGEEKAPGAEPPRDELEERSVLLTGEMKQRIVCNNRIERPGARVCRHRSGARSCGARTARRFRCLRGGRRVVAAGGRKVRSQPARGNASALPCMARCEHVGYRLPLPAHGVWRGLGAPAPTPAARWNVAIAAATSNRRPQTARPWRVKKSSTCRRN